MKILVIFSGLMRGYNPEQHIQDLMKHFPNADHVVTTWKRDVEYDYVNSYYDEPRGYWDDCEIRRMKQKIQQIRDWREENPDADIDEVEDAKIRIARDHIRERKRWTSRSKQILIHALSMKEYAKDYDLIVRARTEIEFKGKTQNLFNMCKLAYASELPIAYGADGKEFQEQQPIILENEHMIPDWMIIHKPEIFNVDKVIEMYEQRTLQGCESGFWQAFNEPEMFFCVQKEVYVTHYSSKNLV